HHSHPVSRNPLGPDLSPSDRSCQRPPLAPGGPASGPRNPYDALAAAPRFNEPCLPSIGERPPSGPNWIHEIKHDGYRLAGVPLLTRNGHDWASRFPLIVQAVDALRLRYGLTDGEAVCCDDDGLPRTSGSAECESQTRNEKAQRLLCLLYPC